MPDAIAKFIDSLDEKTHNALKKKLTLLQGNPFSVPGVIKMKGLDRTYRLRMGSIRIIYIITQSNRVKVIDIDYRGNIY